MTKVTKYTFFLQKIWCLVWHMSAGLRVLAYHLHRFGTFLKPSPWHPRGVRMASWLQHAFCIASAWLPSDPYDSRQLPDQLHVGSSLAPNVFGTVRMLSGRFPKHSRSCPQRGSLQDRLRKMRKHWRQAGCPDVRRTMQTVCRSSFPHPNFALDQNLDAENSLSPEGAETRGSVPGR